MEVKRNKKSPSKAKQPNTENQNQADNPSLKEMTEVIGRLLNSGVPEALYSTYKKLEASDLLELK